MSNIAVTINGEQRQIPGGQTIRHCLEWLEITPDRVAVELNRVIVKKAAWDRILLESGAQLEIVQFVGGG